MDFRLFFKNKFLRKTFGEFAASLENADYNKFKQMLTFNFIKFPLQKGHQF